MILVLQARFEESKAEMALASAEKRVLFGQF